MISYDEHYKQILTPLCRECPEAYFFPAEAALPQVGCCSYSPVFTLFEIYKMVIAKQQDFFLEKIYHNPNHSIKDYEITIHARVNPLFYNQNFSTLSTSEYKDKKLAYSVCQFFEINHGCTLPPSFKTSICRSFICTAIEDKLENRMQQQLSMWSREIQQEARNFNQLQEQYLKEKGWNLHEHVALILEYLSYL